MGMKMYDIDGTREYADKNRGVKASLSWWYKQIAAGKGPRGRKIAGKWYFNESDIDIFIDSHRYLTGLRTQGVKIDNNKRALSSHL